MIENIQGILDFMKRSNLKIIGIQVEVLTPCPRKYTQQSHRRKFSQPKESDAYKHTRSS